MRLRNSYNISVKVIFLTLVCLCLFSFSEEGKGSQNTQQTEAQDSVSLWVKSSLDNNLAEESRRAFLEKALLHANGQKTDSTKLKNLSKIQWSYLMLNDSLLFRRTNRQAQELALTLGDSLRWAGRNWDLGYFMYKNNVKDSAFYHYARAQKTYARKDQYRNAGVLLFDMAGIQAEVKDYTGAEINAVKAAELLKPTGKALELYRIYDLLGIIAKDLKDYERSLEYYSTARQYLNSLEEKKNLEAMLKNNIGVTYKEMGEHSKAIPYFEKVIATENLSKKQPDLYARALTNMAVSLYKLGPKADVQGFLDTGLKIRDSIGDISGLAGSHYFLAEFLLGKNDTVAALTHAEKAKILATQSDNNERLLETLQLLTHIDPANAFAYTKEYIRINDSLQLAERRLREKFARIRFETDEFIAENKVLASQKQILAGIAFGALLLALSIYVIIDQRRKNQKLRFQKVQQQANEEIFNLMLSQHKKFEEGKKMEQKRISEELHDGVLGKMLGARMVLTGLNKKVDEKALTLKQEALELLQKIEGEIRMISHELSNSAYQEIPNFIGSIQSLLDTTENASHINTSLTHDEKVDWDSLSGDIKINLYRIIQESVQNAVKHAKCKHIVLNFATAEDQLHISITDDGKGFNVKKRKKGIGMRNIGSRVKKLEGTWWISSEKGKGTALHLRIPIHYHSEELNEILKKEGIGQSTQT